MVILDTINLRVGRICLGSIPTQIKKEWILEYIQDKDNINVQEMAKFMFYKKYPSNN